jgi:hypothetical protein
MLAVPCGLPTYVGCWPPTVAGAPMIEPLAELAASTPHSSSASGGGRLYDPGPEDEAGAEPPSEQG